MRILITAGPTREPIDAVRFISNRSSGRMGLALVEAARRVGHDVTLIAGPTAVVWPSVIRRIDVETTEQLATAVEREFPAHSLLLMAAAVADFRPAEPFAQKIRRGSEMTLRLVATQDILAAAGAAKRIDQRTVGFCLTERHEVDRAVEKLRRKQLDLIAWNGPGTLDAEDVEAELFWADGRREVLGSRSKGQFADNLLQRSVELFSSTD